MLAQEDLTGVDEPLHIGERIGRVHLQVLGRVVVGEGDGLIHVAAQHDAAAPARQHRARERPARPPTGARQISGT